MSQDSNTHHIPADGRPRCRWCAAAAGDAAYLRYHDREWGFPVDDDRRLFEKLCLEGFQSGLSWRTILNKREAFRAAFAGFDFEQLARFAEPDVERLLQDAGIVRHRGKIEAVINNARACIRLVAEQGALARYIWRFEPAGLAAPVAATETEASRALSKDLKKRGWKFVGPTTMYAFMQSMGLVNDHALGCVTRTEVQARLQAFRRPA
jgi:DNA-3-methyladenine glycosylase I